MDNINKWICDNKEWLFSGVAATVIGLVLKFILFPFLKQKDKELPKQKQSQTNNQSQNVTVNVNQPTSPQIQSITDANVLAKTLTIEGMRAQTNILFIDDDKEFKIVPILKKAGWKNTSFFQNADVKDTSAEKIQKAHIIFVDVIGVGRTMYKEEEGLGLVVDLKKKYPEKKVVIYSAESKHKLFHEAVKLADDQIPKNSQPAVFVSAIETLAEDIWKNT